MALDILNIFDLQYSLEIENAVAVRLDLNDDINSQISKIPRLNIADKVDLQLEFLLKMPGTYLAQRTY